MRGSEHARGRSSRCDPSGLAHCPDSVVVGRLELAVNQGRGGVGDQGNASRRWQKRALEAHDDPGEADVEQR